MRGGIGRFTQQHPIFTIVKGGVGGRNGQVTLNAGARPTRCSRPTPTRCPAFPPGAVLPIRYIQEISPDLENERAWAGNVGVQRQIGARASVAIDANINRGQKHGFLDMNAAGADRQGGAERRHGGGAADRRSTARATRPTRPDRCRRAQRLPPRWTC